MATAGTQGSRYRDADRRYIHFNNGFAPGNNLSRLSANKSLFIPTKADDERAAKDA